MNLERAKVGTWTGEVETYKSIDRPTYVIDGVMNDVLQSSHLASPRSSRELKGGVHGHKHTVYLFRKARDFFDAHFKLSARTWCIPERAICLNECGYR